MSSSTNPETLVYLIGHLFSGIKSPKGRGASEKEFYNFRKFHDWAHRVQSRLLVEPKNDGWRAILRLEPLRIWKRARHVCDCETPSWGILIQNRIFASLPAHRGRQKGLSSHTWFGLGRWIAKNYNKRVATSQTARSATLASGAPRPYF